MRIWDISPAYLNRASLLEEHHELHGMFSIIINEKKGYSKHPETLRWVNYLWALRHRYQELRAEMLLRSYNEKSPLIEIDVSEDKKVFPEIFIDSPARQFEILREKYIDKEEGRIPLPKNSQELWRHHKYSVMARDYNLYKKIGKTLADKSTAPSFDELALLMCNCLRRKPEKKGIRNSLEHIWGYVKEYSDIDARKLKYMSNKELLELIQVLSMSSKQKYILESTALSDLAVWIDLLNYC